MSASKRCSGRSNLRKARISKTALLLEDGRSCRSYKVGGPRRFRLLLEGVMGSLALKMENDETEYSSRADMDVVSPLFDSTLHKMSRTRSEVSDGVYASDYSPAVQYVRRRHQSQDGPVPESESDSSDQLNSQFGNYPAAHTRFHHKEA